MTYKIKYSRNEKWHYSRKTHNDMKSAIREVMERGLKYALIVKSYGGTYRKSGRVMRYKGKYDYMKNGSSVAYLLNSDGSIKCKR